MPNRADTGAEPKAECGPITSEGYREVTLATSFGHVAGRYYPAAGRPEGAARGAIWVGGVGCGWDTPARGLYPRLCRALQGENIASLRIRYRNPTALAEAVRDVEAGIRFLAGEGIERIALTGHSFGGAVVIAAAARSPMVRAVVALATQSHGADAAARLGPRCALLLIHGRADEILPPVCSRQVHAIAHAPKALHLVPGGHVLDEAAAEVEALVRDWITRHLAEDAPQ